MTTRLVVSLAAVLATALAFQGCDGRVSGGDSESHFLTDCSSTCSAGLVCLCGVCTKACTDSSECTPLDPRAECVAIPDSWPCRANAVSSCDVACLSNDGCASLGAGAQCIDGRCRISADAGTSGVPYCGAAQRAFPPAPPASSGGTGDVQVVSVQYSIDLGDDAAIDSKRYEGIGFDLDATCNTTNNLTPSTCLLPAFAGGVADGPGGIDNAAGAVFNQVRKATGGQFSSDNYSKLLQRGNGNIVLRLTQWNGQTNDDQVVLDTYVASPFNASNPAAVPAWDGNDVWPVRADSVSNGDVNQPLLRDSHAYVRDSTLVASLAVADLRLEVGLATQATVSLRLKVYNSVLTCRLEPTTGGAWPFNMSQCTLGGSWIANDLVHQLGYFPDPLQSKLYADGAPPAVVPLCADALSYPTFRNTLCSFIDGYSLGSSKTQTCDAMSVGFTWTNRPAHLGGVVAVPAPANPCPTPATDPANDCCENPNNFPTVGQCGYNG